MTLSASTLPARARPTSSPSASYTRSFISRFARNNQSSSRRRTSTTLWSYPPSPTTPRTVSPDDDTLLVGPVGPTKKFRIPKALKNTLSKDRAALQKPDIWAWWQASLSLRREMLPQIRLYNPRKPRDESRGFQRFLEN